MRVLRDNGLNRRFLYECRHRQDALTVCWRRRSSRYANLRFSDAPGSDTTTTTLAPCLAKPTEAARPMPLPPPVTRATFPVKSMCSVPCAVVGRKSITSRRRDYAAGSPVERPADRRQGGRCYCGICIWMSRAACCRGRRKRRLAAASLKLPEMVLTLSAATTWPFGRRTGTAMPQMARSSSPSTQA